VLHAAWRDGLVVFGWRGRVLPRHTTQGLVDAVFLDGWGDLATETLTLNPPGRAKPLEVTGFCIPVSIASEAWMARPWVPWRELSASLAWFADVMHLTLELAHNAMVIPALSITDSGASARWSPVVDDAVGSAMADLASRMPEVVGLLSDAQPWQITTAVVDAFLDDTIRARLWGAEFADPAPRNRAAAAVVSRRFINALIDEYGEISANSVAERSAVAKLVTRVHQWSAPARSVSVWSSLVAQVRVVPPNQLDINEAHEWADLDPYELPWLIEIGLARSDDQSLVVESPSLWTDRGAAAKLGLSPETAQDALRALATRLAKAAPTLADALDEKHPANAALSLDETMVFLNDEAEQLVASGVDVLLPSWWTGKLSARARGVATPAEKSVTDAGLEAKSLAKVDWSLALGDQRLTPEEIERIAGAKTDSQVLFTRGQWIAFDPAQVRRALTAMSAQQQLGPLVSAIELMQMAAEAGTTEDVELHGQEWTESLLQGLPDERLTALNEPKGFVGTLRPYQQRGLGWLAFLHRLGLGGCLADDMGLGKTAQVLALLAHERADGAAVGPTLVVCPLSVVRNWEAEAARFTPELRVLVHHGPDRSGDDALPAEARQSDLVVTTYATATRDVAVLANIEWRRVVADEAQQVKNSSTHAARALRRIPAEQKLALTGTPVENRLSELWAICDLVNPGLLGSATKFRERFAVPIERHRDPVTTARLQQLVQPFLLRRSKSDRALVPELPPKVEQVAYATLTREQATLYRAAVDHLLDSLKGLKGIDRRGAILATITRLKQICNHPAHFLGDGSKLEGRSGKLHRFDELVEDSLDTDGAMLVFTQYRKMGELLVQHLHQRVGLRVPFLHGGVTKTRRDRMVDELQDGTGGPILVVSLKAGGSGLNLTAANHVVHYDRWWNPAVENQASDRAWRIGQTRTVLVSKLVCQGTIEDRIDDLMNAKADLFQRVMGGGENWITELTTEELRELLTLRGER
jgi:SNF2 family DNA or RNA helicase